MSKNSSQRDRTATPKIRRCTGVPAYRGEPSRHCNAELPTGEPLIGTRIVIPVKCESCNDEIEQRIRLAENLSVNDGRYRQLKGAGLSEPVATGRKSLNTIRPITPEHQIAKEAIERWVRWTPQDGCSLGIRLVGDPGTGKSDLAEVAIAAVARAGRRALYTNARTLLLKLQASYRDDAPESTDAIIDRYATAEYLALDDLGVSKPTRFTGDALYELFERRTRDQLPTIIVTNYVGLSDLALRLAPSDGDELDSIRPVDRIDELCPRVIVIRGTSLRATISREKAR